MKFNRRGNKGFTLIELVVVFAVITLVMAAVSATISKGRQSGIHQDIATKLRTFEAGLLQYKTYKGSLPVVSGPLSGWNPLSSSFSAAYIDPGLATDYYYYCYTSTNQAAILTAPLSTATEATDTATILQDSGLCSSTTILYTSRIKCVLKTFDGSANCK